MLIISNINSSFPCPCALRPLLFPWPQHWDMGLGFFPLSFCSLFKQADSIYYSVGAKYIEKPTILSFSSLHTPPLLLPLSAIFSDFRALSNSFFWDQLQARSPVSCDVLGETEWDGDEGKVLWVGQGKHIPIWLKPIFCSLCLSWFHPHPLLYFTENGGSAKEGAHIWVPDSHWLSHPSPALEGLSVQLALPFFWPASREAPTGEAQNNLRASCWGGSGQLWAVFSGLCSLKHLTLSRASAGLLFSPYRHKMRSIVVPQCPGITLVKFVFPETKFTGPPLGCLGCKFWGSKSPVHLLFPSLKDHGNHQMWFFFLPSF